MPKILLEMVAVDRGSLDVFASDELRGTEVTVTRDPEALRFTLVEQLGRSATAAAWAARDATGNRFAIKFALRTEYHTHSLEAEADRVRQLRTPLIAKIIFYGVPQLSPPAFDGTPFYAIVVEWINGPTLKDFLSERDPQFTPEDFRQFTRDLCEILKALRSAQLVHNDLHDANIIVSREVDSLTDEVQQRLVAIDTGQLKTEETRTRLLEKWGEELAAIETASDPSAEAVAPRLAQLRDWISYFSQTDQEWVTCHLCSLFNHLLDSEASRTAQCGRFLIELPTILRTTLDPDPSRRLADPLDIFRAIESAWKSSGEFLPPGMQSPFDLPSAELIRSDRQLMDLFADEYPRLEECRSNSPVYIYGPRGCGKSTILRSLSLKAILNSADPGAELQKVQFTGVYLSCSSELRSRFWLVPETDYDVLAAHVVRYFNLLLVEELTDTLDQIHRWDQSPGAQRFRFGLTDDLAHQCCSTIRDLLDLTNGRARHIRTSHFSHMKSEIRQHRSSLWRKILRREPPTELPNSQLVFDITKALEGLCPFLEQRRLAFLLDDYSNQRIPEQLQRKLNQSITFAKQGAPIFKVSSEYDGLDLAGIQEGREVREVNVGFEYVSLQDRNRWYFLRSLLERRFKYLGHPADMLTIFTLSHIHPAISMAKAIRDAVENKRKFYYHGLDTLSDVCSGDFAMGLDLARRIFEQANVNWKAPSEIAPQIQNRVIRAYASREFEYIRYRSKKGLIKYEIVDRLCWLSHQCVLNKTRRKDGEDVPLVKNHIDISETALQALARFSEEHYELLEELIRKGILFPLETSKSREAHQGTRRFMVRRILLARYDAPLGRDVPIRIDDLERLRTLLTEPKQFAESELARTNASRSGDPQDEDSQPSLF
ncbi:MAG TPA: protein kinase [Planctomycetaceae bacterium]|jgi:tRNA A-37 threonylcarbamoyl transferase component Bud32|nr:protein kinase [Planctomycetaceae bacterium]